MLQLIDVKKDYKTPSQTVQALKGVNLCFRKNEFVSILGASGCGKTTLLNIIGGLDHYTSGDLVINGKSTKAYKDHDWDVYRNHRIGFVFQSYNLIPHQTVLGNVEIALTIAGISKAERRQRAMEALKKVGLEQEVNKRPNQLSGGQMQRVAIARALVNNPEILLADEPTGALDTVTSVQIMDLIREISGERLVIMVTHNPELAEEYSSRIVRLQDGLVISDSNPCSLEELAPETLEQTEGLEEKSDEKQDTPSASSRKQKQKKKERSSMSYKTSLGLSARNLATKKGRTALTSIAGSIGIISVCLVLALSNGFNNYILKTEEDMLSYYPIEITETSMDVESIMSGMTSMTDMPDLDKIGDRVYVNSFLTNIAKGMTVTNNISPEYTAYLESMNPDYYAAIQYGYGEDIMSNFYTDAAFEIQQGDKTYQSTGTYSLSALKAQYVAMLSQLDEAENTKYAQLSSLVGYLGSVVNKMPGTADLTDKEYGDYVLSQYDVIDGRFPQSANEAVLVVGDHNDVTDITLVQLGLLDSKQFLANLYKPEGEMEETKIDFSIIREKAYYLCNNDEIYHKNAEFTAENPWMFEYDSCYNFAIEGMTNPDTPREERGRKITISGVLRLKEGRSYGCLSSGLNITEQLVDEYIEENSKTELATWVREADSQTLRLTAANLQAYIMQAAQTGDYMPLRRAVSAVTTPSSVAIYTDSFYAKECLLDYLDAWNDTCAEDAQVKYTDMVGMMMSMVQTMLDAITYVLVAFTAISLVVSSVMIGIITYVSVVERVKEIGVLRSLGARKRDIKNLFNAETFIIGLASGLIGVVVTYTLSLGINALFWNLASIKDIADLPLLSAGIMIAISIILTLISGLIPASAAAKKDPVVALRTE